MFPGRIYSQWSTDPAQNLIVGYGLNPEIASDSAGGCYITYEQNLGYPRHLILERLNRYGYKAWGSSKSILGEYPEQWQAKIVDDGRGGVIVAYVDYYYSDLASVTQVRVQRVDSSGNFLWVEYGVKTSTMALNQSLDAVASDGNGSTIVLWRDETNKLRLQRIDTEKNRRQA